MTAGRLESVYGGVNVDDNSCASALSSLNVGTTPSSIYVAKACSSDPVSVGTTIFFTSGGTWSVTSITATAKPVIQSASSCPSDSLCALPFNDVFFVVACCFSVLFGYRTGLIN